MKHSVFWLDRLLTAKKDTLWNRGTIAFQGFDALLLKLPNRLSICQVRCGHEVKLWSLCPNHV